jgi:hypothetical protein
MKLKILAFLMICSTLLGSCASSRTTASFVGIASFDRSESGDELLTLRWNNETRRPVCIAETFASGRAVSEWLQLQNVQTGQEISYVGPIQRAVSWPPSNIRLIPPSGRLSVTVNLTDNFDLDRGAYRAEISLPSIFCDDVTFPRSQEEDRFFSPPIVTISAMSEQQ